MTEIDKTEKRKHQRVKCDFGGSIETSFIGRKQIFFKNISEGGIYTEIIFPNNERPSISIACIRYEKTHIELELNNNKICIWAHAKWIQPISNKDNFHEKKYCIGFEFISTPAEYTHTIRNFINSSNKQQLSPNIPLFPLLINGIEIDTGKYDFQPYTEKYLVEPAYTAFTIKNLKQDKLTDNYNEFILGKYCIGDECIFNEAIISAYNASLKYRTFNLDFRAKIIVDIHNRLLKNRNYFTDLLIAEGHPIKLARWEIDGMLKGTDPQTINFYKSNLSINIGTDNNEKILLQRKPDGVVCLATPKNAPSSISVIGVFALLAGNTIIIKPPLNIPISTIYFWKDIVNKSAIQNGAPNGTINIVVGNSEKIFNTWLSSPLVNDIIYIGDSKKGIEFGKKIYSSGKKPILELSGNDKMFIWKDAQLNLAADSLLECFYGSSQICMVPKIAFVHNSVFDNFINIFIEKATQLKPGFPSDPETVLSPVGKIPEYFKVLANALENGGKLLLGGKRINHFGLPDENGYFIQPTVVSFNDSQITDNLLCVKEEIFFPLLPIISVSGDNDKEIFDKMIKYSNINNFGLRISIWTSSQDYIDKFSSHIMHGGIIRINSSHIGFSLFLSNNGGTGMSGGPFGEMNYIWQKTTHLQGISISSL